MVSAWRNKVNIIYIHGFASKFDPNSTKIKELSKLGDVNGFNIDYTLGESSIIKESMSQITKNKPDLIVGTSMGGWLSTKLSEISSCPFVALNPVIFPSVTLKRYIGRHKDFYGNGYFLEQKVLDDFTDISTSGHGIIFLDKGDELIDSSYSKKYLEPYYNVISYEGGSHRFEHITESLNIIQNFMNKLY